jgi:hypothetical protein
MLSDHNWIAKDGRIRENAMAFPNTPQRSSSFPFLGEFLEELFS